MARPQIPTTNREKTLEVLGCKNPTVVDSRTRSVCRAGCPATGIVDSGAIRTGRGGAIRMVKAPAVQGFELAPQLAGNVCVDTVRVETSYECKKKRKFVYFEKTKKFEPASQIELLNRENVGNSESYSTIDKARVCTNSVRTDTIRTDNNSIVIEELNNNPVDNPYHVPRSQEELYYKRLLLND